LTFTQITKQSLFALEPVLARRVPSIVSPEPGERDALVGSAVMVPFLFITETPHLLLTRRSMSVAHHKGQVCFPGGIREVQDPSLVHTALRETEEELGIPSREITVVGMLDATTTPTGFHITPFLGILEMQAGINPNPTEIDKLLIVPLERLAASRSDNSGMVAFQVEGDLVWGATARIIDQTLHLILK
jgi:8-oxo-dGTP pyrophosphatase MutT (NUDIX family)